MARALIFAALLLGTFATSAASQIRFDARLDKDAYLQGEPVTVVVDILNTGDEAFAVLDVRWTCQADRLGCGASRGASHPGLLFGHGHNRRRCWMRDRPSPHACAWRAHVVQVSPERLRSRAWAIQPDGVRKGRRSSSGCAVRTDLRPQDRAGDGGRVEARVCASGCRCGRPASPVRRSRCDRRERSAVSRTTHRAVRWGGGRPDGGHRGAGPDRDRRKPCRVEVAL